LAIGSRELGIEAERYLFFAAAFFFPPFAFFAI
jgi:hypothetical protein